MRTPKRRVRCGARMYDIPQGKHQALGNRLPHWFGDLRRYVGNR